METRERLGLVVAALGLLFTFGQAATLANDQIQTVTSPPSTTTTGTSQISSISKEPTPVRVPGSLPSIITGPLLNNGGPVQTAPVIYVVYWGWGSDPNGEQVYLNDFLSTVGGNPWLNTVVQYSAAGNPTNLYGGSWSDPSAIPTQPTDAQIQSEALAAVHHFGLGTSVNIQIVVATPTGHSTAGFGIAGGFCAYHGKIAAYPNVTYTNLPYMTDAGSACGANLVNGPLDGVSIVEGHELAESITDPLLNAWKDASGNEIGDKCAWTNLADITTTLGKFAVQPLWSNAANGCVLSTAGSLPPPTITSSGVACPSTLVQWQAVPGATSYQVWSEERRPTPAPSYSKVWTGTALQLRVTLSNGQSFAYEAVACNATGCSQFSNGTIVTYGICP
jgi:hypothetical protein